MFTDLRLRRARMCLFCYGHVPCGYGSLRCTSYVHSVINLLLQFRSQPWNLLIANLIACSTQEINRKTDMLPYAVCGWKLIMNQIVVGTPIRRAVPARGEWWSTLLATAMTNLTWVFFSLDCPAVNLSVASNYSSAVRRQSSVNPHIPYSFHYNSNNLRYPHHVQRSYHSHWSQLWRDLTVAALSNRHLASTQLLS